MGKQGPCTHCGIATTPLWRNGPPEKPVLCNACGSRWRTRGTLEGYMPLHAGGLGLGSSGSSKAKLVKKPKPPSRAPKVKSDHELGPDPYSHRPGSRLGFNLKRKQPVTLPSHFADETDDEDLEDEGFFGSFAGKSLPRGEYHQGYGDWERSDEEGSDELLLFGSRKLCRPKSKMGRSASTGQLPTDSQALAFPVPSRKRSTTGRSRGLAVSPASTWNQSPSSFLDDECGAFLPNDLEGSPEDCDDDDLMVHNMSPMVSMELGLGSLMVRTPSFDTLEGFGRPGGVGELCDLDFSYKEGSGVRKNGLSMHRVSSVSSLRLGEHKAFKDPKPNKALLEDFPYLKRNVLSSCHSPLVFLDWKDIVNCDNFYLLLTAEERGGLLRMLPPLDTTYGQHSVSEMFTSPQFESAVVNFQHLLLEGVFDASEKGSRRDVTELFYQLRLPEMVNLKEGGWWKKWDALHMKTKDRAAKLAAKAQQVQGAGGPHSKGLGEKIGGGITGVQVNAGCIDEQSGVTKSLDLKHEVLLTPGLSEPERNSDFEWNRGPGRGLLEGEDLSTNVYPRNDSGAGVDSRSLESGYGGYHGDSNSGSGYGLLDGDTCHMGDAASLFLDVPGAVPSLGELGGLGTGGGLLHDDSAARLDSGGLLVNSTLGLFQDPVWDNLMWDSSCSAPQSSQSIGSFTHPGPG